MKYSDYSILETERDGRRRFVVTDDGLAIQTLYGELAFANELDARRVVFALAAAQLKAVQNNTPRLRAGADPGVGRYRMAVQFLGCDGAWHTYGTWHGTACGLEEAKASAINVADDRIDEWRAELIEFKPTR